MHGHNEITKNSGVEDHNSWDHLGISWELRIMVHQRWHRCFNTYCNGETSLQDTT